MSSEDAPKTVDESSLSARDIIKLRIVCATQHTAQRTSRAS